jgi:O-antigen/teichoic acid export membrane protein
LGAELYGLYTLLVQWGSFAAELAKAGFAAALVRFVGVYRAHGHTEQLKGAIWAGIRFVGGVGAVLVLLALVYAEPFARWLLRQPEAAAAVRFYAPAIVLTALYGIFLATLTGFQQQRFVQLSNAVVGNLVKLGALVLLLWMGLDLYAALAASLLQDAVVAVLSAYFVVRVFPAVVAGEVPAQVEWRPLITYALTIFATSLFYRYTFQLDVLILGMFRSAAEVGLYAAALRIQPLLALPTYALGETFNPVVAELSARGEQERLRVVYGSTVRWSLLATFPLVLPVVLLPGEVLSIFGAEFRAAAPVLQLLAVGTWLGAAFGVAGYVLNMAGKPQVNLVNGLVTAGLNIGLFTLAIPRWGMIGAAVVYAVVNVAMALVRVGQVWWLFRLHPWGPELWRAVAVVGIALGGAVGAGALVSQWLGAFVGMLLFGALVRVARSRYDRALWTSWRGRGEPGAESGARLS